MMQIGHHSKSKHREDLFRANTIELDGRESRMTVFGTWILDVERLYPTL